MSRTVVVVSPRQVSAAQRLVRISGGADKVDPLIRKIAEAKLDTEPDTTTKVS